MGGMKTSVYENLQGRILLPETEIFSDRNGEKLLIDF